MPGFNIGGMGGGQPNTVESTRKHRYLIRVFQPLSADLLFFARKVALPQVEIDRIVMHHKQEEIYLPGKHRIQQCEISFYRVHDNNGDRAAREIYDWWAKNLVDVQQSKLVSEGGTFKKKNAEIHVLDGNNNPVYKYHLYGCWPQKVSPETLDYGDNNVAEVTVTFLVDKLKEEPGAAGQQAEVKMC